MTTHKDVIEELCERLRDCCELLEHHAAQYRPHLPRYAADINGRLALEKANAVLTQEAIGGLSRHDTKAVNGHKEARAGVSARTDLTEAKSTAYDVAGYDELFS